MHCPNYSNHADRGIPELCVIEGVQACNPGMPILAEDLANQAERVERV